MEKVIFVIQYINFLTVNLTGIPLPEFLTVHKLGLSVKMIKIFMLVSKNFWMSINLHLTEH